MKTTVDLSQLVGCVGDAIIVVDAQKRLFFGMPQLPEFLVIQKMRR
jgi:hypothetical protein